MPCSIVVVVTMLRQMPDAVVDKGHIAGHKIYALLRKLPGLTIPDYKKTNDKHKLMTLGFFVFTICLTTDSPTSEKFFKETCPGNSPLD